MPAMSGANGRADCRNSDNRKGRACITYRKAPGICKSGRKTHGNGRICVLFCVRNGCFCAGMRVKIGGLCMKNGEKRGVLGLKFWGAVGMQKGRVSTMFLTLARSLLCVSVYLYKWTNEHCKGLRVSGLQQVGGGRDPGRFWPTADGFPRKIFYFFAFSPIQPLSDASI